VDVDREKVKQEGISLTDLFQTMQIYLGSVYVNDFNKFGRTYQVIVQADAPFRATAENISQLKVRNASGEMVPLGSVIQVKESYGPDRGLRYNAYPAADINGGPAPGVSSGQAVAIMERLARETLPNGIGFEWTELTYQQILAGNTALFVFPLCVFLAFLVLAAQYESWSLPLAVILIVPLCLLSAITGVWLTRGDNNIFTQIGFLVLVALACKNAILIVEFARELQLRGVSPVQAALEACRIRLRPILMTSFAFIMGVVPLVFSSGAGAEMRTLGVAVFSRMLKSRSSPGAHPGLLHGSNIVRPSGVWTPPASCRRRATRAAPVLDAAHPRLAACATAPGYRPSAVEVPPAFREAASDSAPATGPCAHPASAAVGPPSRGAGRAGRAAGVLAALGDTTLSRLIVTSRQPDAGRGGRVRGAGQPALRRRDLAPS
jgi:hypothetical protein